MTTNTRTAYTIADNATIITKRAWNTAEEAAAIMSGLCYHPKVYDGPFRVVEIQVEDRSSAAAEKLSAVFGFAQFSRIQARWAGLEAEIFDGGSRIRSIGQPDGSDFDRFRVLA